jgi:hypothetical protein
LLRFDDLGGRHVKLGAVNRADTSRFFLCDKGPQVTGFQRFA